MGLFLFDSLFHTLCGGLAVTVSFVHLSVTGSDWTRVWICHEVVGFSLCPSISLLSQESLTDSRHYLSHQLCTESLAILPGTYLNNDWPLATFGH